MTAPPLFLAFLAAPAGLGHGGIVAVMFVVALALLTACLVELLREIRIPMTTMRVD